MHYDLSKHPDSELDCPRCDTRMKDCGPLGLHARRDGVLQLPNLTRADINTVEFQTYACPNCGKVEFFV